MASSLEAGIRSSDSLGSVMRAQVIAVGASQCDFVDVLSSRGHDAAGVMLAAVVCVTTDGYKHGQLRLELRVVIRCNSIKITLDNHGAHAGCSQQLPWVVDKGDAEKGFDTSQWDADQGFALAA
ncbi:hypothetical protein CDD82_5029 [Ophiocordyceps australis]|uniref:Uncharacterized protein n=1 Tax=Ophiocordyceps australis TaxID=1399860 RepID=A0A2C5Z2P1_9HYPO|nr:hypothetical protein CDD82_5029 [Ophiocordyceps australis]